MPIPVGLKGFAQTIVAENNTAAFACSGSLPVFGTPYMAALMENASWTSIEPYVAAGESTVGTKLTISHLSATPIGSKVWAESKVTEVDGRRIVLSVCAYDEAGKIGEGTHERFVITKERFLEKAEGKRKGE